MRIGLRAASLLALACLPGGRSSAQSFGEDVAFVRRHASVVVLADPAGGGARVAVSADLQGRVLTSSAGGDAGPSHGWINRALFESGRRDPHFNAFGGEDRVWLGPEGGQFALFFRKGDPFDLAHWTTPAPLDTEPFAVNAQAADRVAFAKDMAFFNYAGTWLELRLDRTIRLVGAAETWKGLGLEPPPGVTAVAFESENKVTNTGGAAWRKETGLVSIWILGMFRPSPTTTVVMPFRRADAPDRSPVVNDGYFGKVPADRLAVADGAVFFRGDGRHRSKIGLSPSRAQSVLGSFDPMGPLLTLVAFTRPDGAADYVNSMWETQANPFGGDVSNSYNDGPPAPGVPPLGPFYELESSSPAAALAPRQSIVHCHRTIHLTGARAGLDAVARKALGVGLDRIEAAFGPGPR
jgi:hypothetical protein